MAVKILIADDEENVCRGIAGYLRLKKKDQVEIYVAGDGQEAMEILIQHRPDLVLLDIQMPVKDGLQVMKEMRAAGLNDTKIVVLSGFDEFAYAQQAIHYGAVDYILKPCHANQILEILERFFPSEGDQEKNDDTGKNVIVQSALDYIDRNYSSQISLTELAETVGVSPSYLSTLFTRHLEMGFVDYVNKVRVEKASIYLTNPKYKTYEVAYKVGFKDEKYFAKVFKKITGKSPSDYRRENKGEF